MLCSNQRLHQTVYFLNRDLTFMREVIIFTYFDSTFFSVAALVLFIYYLFCVRGVSRKGLAVSSTKLKDEERIDHSSASKTEYSVL